MSSSGAGSRLPYAVLGVSGVCALIAVCVSAMSIYLHLKNYRKPALQRMVIRIMVMVPIYAIASFISLFSLRAAFFIDAVRDIYEAFVIYCFFVLLTSYLGGERSLLISLHGRPPKESPFPLNIFKAELDVSDPYFFLFLKRGILQYVQVKPVLAVITMILKAAGVYNEGNLQPSSGYLWVSIVYNFSICLSLYCLALFWICVNDDLKPFRPVPKFLCVKGILFFSFWQSIGISILVTAGAIKHLGPYTDRESISTGLTDCLICIEMPLFAIAHMYAFSKNDFIDKEIMFVARMPILYAMRDAFGFLDVVEDSKSTLRGEGMDYREFEPSEGLIHQGAARDNRIQAGLRYSKGGRRKYWLPKPAVAQPPKPWERRVNRVIARVAGEDQTQDVQAPLLGYQEDDVVHSASDLRHNDPQEEEDMWTSPHREEELGYTGYELPFGDLDEADEALYDHCRKYLFGDYNYPCIDASSEQARISMWDEEERVLRDERGAWFSPIRGARGSIAIDQRQSPAWTGYGATGSTIARDKRKDLPHIPPGKVIDFDADRTDPADRSDVRLKWVKTPSVYSPVPIKKEGTRSRTSSGPSSAESSSAARTRARKDSGSKPRSNASPTLPPDAVDLIVEDEEALEEERVKERKKGEPAVRHGTNLRKVYRRGFVAHEDDGTREEGELEVEATTERVPGERVDAAEDILQTIGDEGPEPSVAFSPSPPKESIVATAESPPLKAFMRVDKYDDDDGNPWA